jgi:hypothetical protein
MIMMGWLRSSQPPNCQIGAIIESGQRLRRRAMKYFVGLDVSLQETAICIVDEDGNDVA